MGLEKIIWRLDPLCTEISIKTPKICHLPISMIKLMGLGGLTYSLSQILTSDANRDNLILVSTVSGILYTGGVIADYFVNKAADILTARRKEQQIQKEFEELYKEHINNEVIKAEMIDKYPILEDYELNKRFPEIKDVALHIYSRIKGKSINKIWRMFPSFERLELYNLGQYIGRLRNEDLSALKEYNKIKENLAKKPQQGS